jgi:hypothetical protein
MVRAADFICNAIKGGPAQWFSFCIRREQFSLRFLVLDTIVVAINMDIIGPMFWRLSRAVLGRSWSMIANDFRNRRNNSSWTLWWLHKSDWKVIDSVINWCRTSDLVQS